jgi:hypothetical protein
MTKGSFFIICTGWVLCTFALHCWILFALAGMPRWESAKSDASNRTMTLNGVLTGFKGTLEERGQERLVMQNDQKGDQKLSYALRFPFRCLSFLGGAVVRWVIKR